MKITERTRDRLVVVSRPRLAFGIAIVLGLAAFAGALHAMVFQGEGASKDNLFGLVLGPLFVGGSLLLYRETTTVLDRSSNRVEWVQRGLVARKADGARLDQIRDVVVGRPVSDQTGGAQQVSIVLEDRVLPLMYGFSALNRDEAVRAAILEFVRPHDSRQ